MELNPEALYQRALELSRDLPSIPLGKERIQNAKRFKDSTFREAQAFLRDYKTLAAAGTFSQKQLATMLADTCVEMTSFLFSAGAPKEMWRRWCVLAGFLLVTAEDASYALQLIAIARDEVLAEVASVLRERPLGSYRDEAIRAIILHQGGAKMPSHRPASHPLDDFYEKLLGALTGGRQDQMVQAIGQIAGYWLEETEYGRFEPGAFPVFEPEINGVVSALVMRGFELKFNDAKVRKFLQAGLE